MADQGGAEALELDGALFANLVGLIVLGQLTRARLGQLRGGALKRRAVDPRFIGNGHQIVVVEVVAALGLRVERAPDDSG